MRVLTPRSIGRANPEEARAPRRERSFELGSRISEFLSGLAPRTLAWSAIAAAFAILVPAAVITAVIVKEEGAPLAGLGRKADQLPRASSKTAETPVGVEPQIAVQSPAPVGFSPAVSSQAEPVQLSEEQIDRLIRRGRDSIATGDIETARVALKRAAEAGNAIACLELGGTYDPVTLREILEKKPLVRQVVSSTGVGNDPIEADVAMAKAWYEKARDLGSTEARVRLDRLTQLPTETGPASPKRKTLRPVPTTPKPVPLPVPSPSRER
jgi:hypothetical protein